MARCLSVASAGPLACPSTILCRYLRFVLETRISVVSSRFGKIESVLESHGTRARRVISRASSPDTVSNLFELLLVAGEFDLELFYLLVQIIAARVDLRASVAKRRRRRSGLLGPENPVHPDEETPRDRFLRRSTKIIFELSLWVQLYLTDFSA